MRVLYYHVIISGSERKVETVVALNRGMLLPWGAQKERSSHSGQIDMEIRPGEFVMRNLFADFTVLAEKKIEFVMTEPQVTHKSFFIESLIQLKKNP